MSDLIVPGHVARKRHIDNLKKMRGNGAPQQIKLPGVPDIAPLNARMQSDEEYIADLHAAIDTGKLKVPLWKIITTPVMQRSVSKGGILFADETVDMQDWTHQLHKIVLVGRHVYKGPQYQGYDIQDDEIPKVGQLWIVDPKQPRRFRFKGRLFIVLNDDQLVSQCDHEDVEHLSFNGLDL